MDYRQQIQAIKGEYLHGKISYEKAKADVEALLVPMNARMQELCKDNGMKFKKLTFTYVFR